MRKASQFRAAMHLRRFVDARTFTLLERNAQETMTRAFVMFSRAERNVQQRARKWREWRDVAVHRRRTRVTSWRVNVMLHGDDVNIETMHDVARGCDLNGRSKTLPLSSVAKNEIFRASQHCSAQLRCARRINRHDTIPSIIGRS